MRTNRGKLFGAALGFSFGGPIGALIGTVVGHYFDAGGTKGRFRYSRESEKELHFITSLILLLTGTARADGVVTLQEMEAIRVFFSSQLGYKGPELRFIDDIIRESFRKQVDLQRTCVSIAKRTSYEERLFLLHLNYQVAVSDGRLSAPEEEYIRQVSINLGIQEYDYLAIRNGFSAYRTASGGEGSGSDTGEGSGGFRPGGERPWPMPPRDPYAVLGVRSGCTDEELHKAFRNMAGKYHPDRVSHLGREFIELANRRFTEIHMAYERIRDEREIGGGN
jgi:DnaJ like chaperone protein